MENYALIFDAGESGDDGNIPDGDFNSRWGWFGVMHRLCGEKIVNLEAITKLNLLECLTWLCYETDLNEQNKVKRNDI